MLHARFCMLGADLHAQLVLINKISASELSRKFIKGALLVGQSFRFYWRNFVCFVLCLKSSLVVYQQTSQLVTY